MRISDNEIKKILDGHYAIVELPVTVPTTNPDAELIEQVAGDVAAMPDREHLVAELKAKIEAGTYNPTGDDIADAMIRRSIADRITG